LICFNDINRQGSEIWKQQKQRSNISWKDVNYSANYDAPRPIYIYNDVCAVPLLEGLHRSSFDMPKGKSVVGREYSSEKYN